jgi:arginine decarboxylase
VASGIRYLRVDRNVGPLFIYGILVPMERTITLTKGTGSGDTKIAAFDAALFAAGIANYNLIRLSSIIPPGTNIEIGKYVTPPDEFGHKLYIVYACEIQNETGKDAWAGIGWVMTEDGSKKGLFTEHEGHSEQEVQNLITQTLNSMKAYRPESYGEIQQEITGITCTDMPVCALVAAVYQSEAWA